MNGHLWLCSVKTLFFMAHFIRDPSTLPHGREAVGSAARFSRHNSLHTNTPKSCFLEEGKSQGRGKRMAGQEGKMNGNKGSSREQKGVKGKTRY